jgi:UDP-4-amino-4,6-dideoxy-N-acetyl-beta-L-altrosamine transaminase
MPDRADGPRSVVALSAAELPAIFGGDPVRSTFLPYGHQDIDAEDEAAVLDALRADWITQGPRVDAFERAVAERVGAVHAVAVNSGTAALHAAVFAAGLGPGDEVITTPYSFAATANCILYEGATPVFVDVRADTLNIDPGLVAERITSRTRAIIAVDFSGAPADLSELQALCRAHGLLLIEDASHALGATYDGRLVGSISDLTTLSFHPVKHITTGEGGMITTNSDALAQRLRRFRTHGIAADPRTRQERGDWFYEMVDLGYNYRIPDIQCALGLSQLNRLSRFLARRRELAVRYHDRLSQLSWLRLPQPSKQSAWHLYVVRLLPDQLKANRAEVFAALRAEHIGVNVHYIPIHLHPYYRERFGYKPGDFPIAEVAYDQIITLPLHQGMGEKDVEDVVRGLCRIGKYYGA